MPTTPEQCFTHLGLTGRQVPWKTPPPTQQAGIYIIALPAEVDRSRCLASPAKIADWVQRREDLMLHGKRKPEPAEVLAYMAEFWLPDETILYIGKATKLSNRLAQFHANDLGERRSHRGGYWLRTLDDALLRQATTHYAETDQGKQGEAESMAMRYFIDRVSQTTRAAHPQPDRAMPYANIRFHEHSRYFDRQGRTGYGIENPYPR